MSDSTITTQTFLFDLINRVIKKFEKSHHVKVTGDGRRQLIQPALPHSEDVKQALREETITIEFLEECVLSILRDAFNNNSRKRIGQLRIGRTRHSRMRRTGQLRIGRVYQPVAIEITGKDISAAMKRNCPYVFWC